MARDALPHETAVVRDPRAEAAEHAPAGHEVRVLEPSPPAVLVEPFFADDPAAIGDTIAPVVGPTTAADVTWSELAEADARVAAFARHRWLGDHHALTPVPDGYVGAREDFHRLAFGVVAVARRLANGKFGLRYTAGGFGTPFFGDDRQVRVVGNELVVQRADAAESATITTLADAAALVGVTPDTEAAEHDSPELGDLDRPLDTNEDVGRFLADWFGFATSVLEELRVDERAIDAGRTQLWPGHFDPAVEIGDADRGQRATYGASPGDASSAAPYLYVGPWGEIDDQDPFWNAESFPGALLHYADLLAAENARTAALDFYRAALTRLTS